MQNNTRNKEEERMKFYKYGLQSYGEFHDIYGNYSLYKDGIVCKGKEMVYSLVLKTCEKEDFELLGWVADNRLLFVCKNENDLDDSLLHGLAHDLKKKKGKIVYLKVSKNMPCSRADELDRHRAFWDFDRSEACLNLYKLKEALEKEGKEHTKYDNLTFDETMDFDASYVSLVDKYEDEVGLDHKFATILDRNDFFVTLCHDRSGMPAFRLSVKEFLIAAF